jgi:hypothetical protein
MHVEIEAYLLNRVAQVCRLESTIQRHLGLPAIRERVKATMIVVVDNTIGNELSHCELNWRNIPLAAVDALVNNIDDFEEDSITELGPMMIKASLFLEFSQNWISSVPIYVEQWLQATTSPETVKNLKLILREYVACLLETSAFEEAPESSKHRKLADKVSGLL